MTKTSTITITKLVKKYANKLSDEELEVLEHAVIVVKHGGEIDGNVETIRKELDIAQNMINKLEEEDKKILKDYIEDLKFALYCSEHPEDERCW